MKTVCEIGLCTGCKACIVLCEHKAITYYDEIDQVKCLIDDDKCVKCGRCSKICPNNTPVKKTLPIAYFQGWAQDRIRSNSSSGGAASAIMEGFINQGGYVCSCLFEDGQFLFKVTNDISSIRLFSGSKYVKSDPQNAYARIKELLDRQQKVLFIGLPCQSAGIINYFKRHKNLYTIDLICHGTPSSLLLQRYLQELHVDITSIRDIKFRDHSTGNSCGERLLPRRVRGSYIVAFLEAISYTDNCYSCAYASFDRVSDVTLGDAWGQMSETNKGGVSLVLCQSEKGRKLLEIANLDQYEVDIEKAVISNPQLRGASFQHPKRQLFMNAIKRGHSFRYATMLAEPKASIKECIKYVLIKMRLLNDIQEGEFGLIVIK